MTVWAAVDRIEGDRAVLIFDEDGQQLVLAAAALPGGAREGQVYRVTFAVDDDERGRRLERISTLQQRLRARSDKTGPR